MMAETLGMGVCGLGCLSASTRNAEDVKRLLDLFKENDVEITKDLILAGARFVRHLLNEHERVREVRI